MLHAPDTISTLHAGMQCQQCGRPLANPTAICTACDQELSTPTGGGRYRCPACHGLFDDWTTILLPRNARWYTPQSEVTTCPLCEEALEWKRDTEPAQLPAGLEGIAFGMMWSLAYTIPPHVRLWTTEQLGKWFLLLIPLLLVEMYFIAVRPSLQGPGGGPGHFTLAQPEPNSRKAHFLTGLISGIAVFSGYWAAPQVTWLPLWWALFGLAAVGCIAAVVWRRSVERHKRLHAPTTAAPSPTLPS
jgi:hypothetical protein